MTRSTIGEADEGHSKSGPVLLKASSVGRRTDARPGGARGARAHLSGKRPVGLHPKAPSSTLRLKLFCFVQLLPASQYHLVTVHRFTSLVLEFAGLACDPLSASRAEQLNAELERASNIAAQITEQNNELVLVAFVPALAVGASSQLFADNEAHLFWIVLAAFCTSVSVLAAVWMWRNVGLPRDVKPHVLATSTEGLDNGGLMNERFVARYASHEWNRDHAADHRHPPDVYRTGDYHDRPGHHVDVGRHDFHVGGGDDDHDVGAGPDDSEPDRPEHDDRTNGSLDHGDPGGAG